MTGPQQPSYLTPRLDLDFALKAADLGVWELDPMTRQFHWNDRCRELFGLAKENCLTYERAIQYIHPDDVSRVDQAVQRAMNPDSGGGYDETYRTLGADDRKLRWVRFHGRGYFDEAGQLIRFAGIAQEVTQQVEAQQREDTTRQQAQNQQRMYEAITASTPDLMYVFDLSYRFTYANQALLDMWGRSWEQSIGKSLLENGYEPWHAQLHEREIDQVVATKQSIRGEVSFPHATLGRRTYDYVFAPVLNDQGEVEVVAGTTRDITDIKQAQALLQQQQAQQRFLLELSDSLRSLSDPLAMYDQTACLLGAYLGANRVGYAEDQGDGDTIVVLRNYVNGVTDLQGTYQYADYGPLLAELLAGRTVVRSDIAHDPTLTDAQKEAHRVLQLGATVNKPLLKDGRLLAVLFIHYQEAHHWSADELNLLEMVAERLVVAIDRAQAEETLRLSEQRFRFLANAVPQAIWVTDAEGNAEFLNKWWTNYSGIPYEGSTAWQIASEILHPEDGPKVAAAFRQAMQTGMGFEVEQRNRSASGTYRWFLNKGEPYRDPKTGQITRWVGIGVDIHDRKLAEHLLQQSEARYRALSVELENQVQQRTQELATTNEELAASNNEYAFINEELEEANRLLVRSNENLQTFAYVASHDLQEPLRKIQQFGDLLKNRFADAIGEELIYVERMQSAASRMSTLIKDLLNFSRISTQREASKSVSLEEVVKQVLSTLELTIQETGAQVSVEALPTVLGDASQLNQLFQNLLSNALKFRRPGVEPRIAVKASWLAADHLPEDIKPSRGAIAYYQIDVADNGIGFEEKYLDRIFHVFQRLHGKSEFTGTGIGLAICEKVVANHGGAITASSQPGQGATFSVYLPM